MSKLKHVFLAMTALCVILVGSSGSSAEEKSPDGDELEQAASALLLEQKNKGAVLAVQGSSIAGIGGLLVAQVIPELDASELEPGDTYSAPILGATTIGEDGDFNLKLDPSRLPLDVGDNNVYLLHVGNNKDPVAAMGVNLSVGITDTKLGAEDQAGNQIQAISVDLIESTSEPLTSEELSLSQSDAELGDNGKQGPTAEADDDTQYEQYQHGSCDFRIIEKDQAPVTVVVTGTNTSGVTYDVTYDRGASVEVGMGMDFGKGWFEGSSGASIKNTHAATNKWDSFNGYGTYSHRIHHWFVHEKSTRCYLMNPHERVRATGIGIQMNRDKWTNTAYPEYCEKISGNTTGTYTQSTTRATEWTGGAKTKWIGMGINLSTQSGYSETTKIGYKATARNRWLCGRNGYPSNQSEGDPGYMMADFMCRRYCVG